MSSLLSAKALKKQMREGFVNRLAGLSFFDLIEKSGRLSDRFFEWIHSHESRLRGGWIVSFCPFGNEPQINIEKEGCREPYRVGYVRIEDWNGRKMSARAARRDTPDLWEVIEPSSGIRIDQPVATLPEVSREQMHMILVPGLAFSRDGRRLGRGAGFYDRFLQDFSGALRVGVAFDEQISDLVPEEEWDERVDIILTDREIIPTNSYGDWTTHGKIIRRNQK
ncbi:MAG: 5-formyltetrahydrofolate cyclo-ligase [Bdellovibrionales bacterium]|nr:5-formyltetrahydrofolate cyclo-ligase [Bdellovibrionales bacterium]